MNVWAHPGGLGPTVLVRVSDDDSAQPLLQAAAGTVTDFVDVPVTGIFQRPAHLEAVSAEATDDDSARRITSLARPVKEGDEVTVFAHGTLSGDEASLGTFRHDEDSWPEMPADKVSLLVYPGALQPLPNDVNGIGIATTEGECLIDDTGQPNDDGWGGGIPKYFILEPGVTEIAVAHWPGPDCELEPTAGTVTVEGSAGDRVALIPWGTGADEIELMLIDMGRHP